MTKKKTSTAQNSLSETAKRYMARMSSERRGREKAKAAIAKLKAK